MSNKASQQRPLRGLDLKPVARLVAVCYALTLISSNMAKIKKKLTTVQKRAKKAAKAERQKKYQWVFMNGKQVRIKRPPTVDGISVEQFIEENADPIWLHQNELWELMPVEDSNVKLHPANELETTEDDNGAPF